MIVFIAASEVHAENQPETYEVVGVVQPDTLKVRSGPGEKFSVIATLQNGTTGIQIIGQPVMNGNDDWIPIRISDIQGWVRPRYLDRVWPAASLADSSSSPTQDAGSDLESLQRSATPEPLKLSNRLKDKDRAREPSSVSQSSGEFGWFVLMVIAVSVIAAAKKTKKKSLRPNQCPKCRHDTLETRRKFFGGSYRRCSRTFLCGYNEDKIRRAETQAAAERAQDAQRRARWAAEERERRDRHENYRAALLYDQQRKRERNE